MREFRGVLALLGPNASFAQAYDWGADDVVSLDSELGVSTRLGRLLVGLALAWSTLRGCDLVTIGTTTADEAWECCEIWLDLLGRRAVEVELQQTRSKRSLG